jgi:hypothetical protein
MPTHEQRLRYRELGQCPSCGGQTEAVSRCTGCRAKRQEQQVRSRNRRATSERCPYCGKPSAPGNSRCYACLDYHREDMAQRRQKALHLNARI